MWQFGKDIISDIRNQTVSGIATFVLGSLVLWLGLSPDKIRNSTLEFLTNPDNFLINLIGLTFLASIPLLHQFYRTHPRNYSIRNGADIIFEEEPQLWVVNVIDGWAGSTALVDTFNKTENHRRIRNAYINQQIKLISTESQKNHTEDPVSYMKIEKSEFIRWYINSRALPVSKMWRRK